MKILKKGGVVEKRGEEETKSMPHAPVNPRGGSRIKKVALNGGRRENFWGISCEKSRFYAKKIIFFPIAEGGAKILGYFV